MAPRLPSEPQPLPWPNEGWPSPRRTAPRDVVTGLAIVIILAATAALIWLNVWAALIAHLM